jgi:Zn-dependent M28 family amino/carboxypeptidase
VPEGVGANDNASGLAVLLDVAERLPAAKPRATVRLAFWNAEEQGLFGSAAYVRGLGQAERRRIAAYLNFDMVGSPNGRTEVYDGDDAIERALRDALPGREGETPIFEDSDHAPFDRVGIPVGGVYTGGLEERRGRPRDPCYHRRCDGASNVDVALATRVAEGARRAIARLGR